MSQSDMHAPGDLLALHAMGDQLPEAMSRHVTACNQCQTELSQWTHLMAAAHTATVDDVPGVAPTRVWDAIADELELSGNSATATPAPVLPVTPATPPSVAGIASARRRWSTNWLVAASVAGVLSGAAVTATGVALTNSGRQPAPVAAPVVVASTALAALPDHQGDGAAEIVSTPEGKELVVDVSQLTGGDGFHEVWLIDPETFQMVGLGALVNDSGRFPIPAGLDLRRFTVVDVSLEPFDGDPVHSRDSVVRGELST
ncbi:MAG: anti-sigma factor [Actinomycetia bacterium]|nr:anti-sigma factor [Actinomycetes bacterium]